MANEGIELAYLDDAPCFLFFTGKGGVGKTSLSAATALALSERGKRVLLVSTDAASNLDEILGVPLSNQPVAVPSAAGLQLLNIDPETAAESYRRRVLEQMTAASDSERATVREQLSGACTTEIAAFDEFAAMLSAGGAGYDHVIFDTAPTGHTLRLLSLPRAWSGFLGRNDRGADCLGPHSGVKMKETRFKEAFAALADGARTRVVLVTRPERSAIAEAARTARELRSLGLTHQHLAVNGVFRPTRTDDPVARAIAVAAADALQGMPAELAVLPRTEIPLRSFDMVGLPALRALVGRGPAPITRDTPKSHEAPPLPHLNALADELARGESGLIMVMGKGGVGKTTLAAALAVGLVQRGRSVHLTTTDPAAHLTTTLSGELVGLKVSRIDPVAETEKYVERMMATRGAGLDEQARALLREDLRSPCTEEVAVFHAFSRIVSESRSGFVVLDTAPTGHSMLLIDATGAYHRQTLQQASRAPRPLRVVTPLMRLQDASKTHVIIVTLPEPTPVLQALALQDDLRRARIEPFAWVVNRSVAAARPIDPVLTARLVQEHRQIARVAEQSVRTYLVPLQLDPPVGLSALSRLTTQPGPDAKRAG